MKKIILACVVICGACAVFAVPPGHEADTCANRTNCSGRCQYTLRTEYRLNPQPIHAGNCVDLAKTGCGCQ